MFFFQEVLNQCCSVACSSNCNWMAPQHKKPPLSWCIVFQHITHCRSSSFCWSCSCCTRRGGLEVTQSAELLFLAFIMYLILIKKHPAAQKAKRVQLLTDIPRPRRQVSSSDVWLPKVKITLKWQKNEACLMWISIVTATSWNHYVRVIDSY